MIRRPTAILIVILAILAAVAWYSQQPGNVLTKALASNTTPTSSTLGYLLPSGLGEINVIKVQDSNGNTVTLTRGNSGWVVNLGSGQQVADQAASEEAATQGLAIRLLAQIANPPSFEVIGITKPNYILSFTLANGPVQVYKIGKSNVTGDGYYVQNDNGSIVIASKDSIDSLTGLLKNPPLPATATPAVTPTDTAAPATTVAPSTQAPATPALSTVTPTP